MQIQDNFNVLMAHLQASPECNLPELDKNDLLAREDEIKRNLVYRYSEPLWEPAKAFLRSHRNSGSPSGDTEDIVTDVFQAIYQHSYNFKWKKTLPLQQLVCDMWNTFVDTSRICTTTHCLPPIVKWGTEKQGSYAWSNHKICAARQDSVPIISFSTKCMKTGFIWPDMMHETAHTILESGRRLSPILTRAVRSELRRIFDTRTLGGQAMVNYWTGGKGREKNKIEEVGADVMSVLYMGPLAAVGALAAFRDNPTGKLSSSRAVDAVHPASVLRIMILAIVVDELSIARKERKQWYNFLMDEVKKDYNDKSLNMSWKNALKSVECVALTVMNTSVIDERSLRDIRCWNRIDERIVDDLMSELSRDLISLRLRSSAPSSTSSSSSSGFSASSSSSSGSSSSLSIRERWEKDSLSVRFITPHIVAAANKHLLTTRKLTGQEDPFISNVYNWMFKKMQEESNAICNKCDLTIKHVYTPCPASSLSSTEPELSVDQNTGSSNWGMIAFGVGISAALIFGAAVVCSKVRSSSNSDEKSKRKSL